MSIDEKKKSAVAIGNRVRAQRERLGISQEELAAKVGYKGKGSISRIESGENEVKQSKLPLLADALETDVAYLMGWTAPNSTSETNNALSADEKELLSYYRQMNSQGRLSALMSVKGMSEQEVFKKETDLASNC